MAGFLSEQKLMDVTPALRAYSTGAADYRAEQDYAQKQEQRNLLKQVGQTAASQGLNAAGIQAMQGGDVATGIKLQDLSLDRQAKLYDFMGRGAAAADTPEKWQAFIGTLSQTFGPASVKGFEDFRTRESAIMLALNAKEQAALKMQQQGMALREREVAATEKRANKEAVPSGFRPAAGGGLEPIPGGPSDPKYKQAVEQSKGDPNVAQNVAGGLQNLNKMTQTYDDASFTNAVGPIQGSTPDGIIAGTPIRIARVFGEVANLVQGGKNAPSEVRSAITSATETLAAAIKPLIRKPGEGVWTDADQARLVSIVGDLTQASDKAEFKRRLNNVRDSIQSNFGVKIDFDSKPDDAAPTIAKVGSKDEYDKLDPGSLFIGSDGKQYRKPK
jgi:hypothetical protein